MNAHGRRKLRRPGATDAMWQSRPEYNRSQWVDAMLMRWFCAGLRGAALTQKHIGLGHHPGEPQRPTA